jgi:hypothetical protein
MKNERTSFINNYFEGQISYYAENQNAPCSSGRGRAHRAYYETNDYELETYTVKEMPFENDMTEFINTIKEAGIKEFNLCDQSTGLMESLHHLLAAGWQVSGVYEKEINRHNTIKGLCMKKA